MLFCVSVETNIMKDRCFNCSRPQHFSCPYHIKPLEESVKTSKDKALFKNNWELNNFFELKDTEFDTFLVYTSLLLKIKVL